jgi:Beta/Gamma crystallin
MKRVVLALSVVALGCTSPTAPSPLLEGILIYEHPRFEGTWKALTSNVDDLDDLGSAGCSQFSDSAFDLQDWDDCISSIKVAPGWTVTIYEHPRYRGDSHTITSDVSDLEDLARDGGDWDDRISSIRIVPPA